jgi:hypothetical protein
VLADDVSDGIGVARALPWKPVARDNLAIAAALAEREHLLIRAGSRYAPQVSTLPDKLATLRAAISVLSDEKVAHALIGGLAVGIRSGIPRATLDVDIAVASNSDLNALSARMVSGGFALVGRFPHTLNFKHESGEPLQLAFDPEFDAVIDRAEAMSVDDLSIRVVTKNDLIVMKRRAAADPARRRSKALRDQADVALLEGDVPEPDEGW